MENTNTEQQQKQNSINLVNDIIKQEKYYVGLLEREKEILKVKINALKKKKSINSGYEVDKEYELVKLEQQLFHVQQDITAKNRYIEVQTTLVKKNS